MGICDQLPVTISSHASRKVAQVRNRISRSRRQNNRRSTDPQDLMYHEGVRELGQPRPTVQVGRLPFGESMEVRLPYVENFAISASGTSGLTAVGNTFYGNNMFDPRIQLGGHQPMQYDTLATVFSRYRVHRVEVCLTFSNPLYDGMWVGYRCRPNNNSTATAGQTLEFVQEMSNTAIAPLNNTGSQTVTFRFAFDIHAFLGITRAAAADVDYSGLMSGSVSPQAWPIIEPFALHSVSGEDSTVRVNIELIYHARLSDRLTVPQS